ncbi:MAG: hypothetical protein FWF03_08515 [Defluviitaleaceae bacterium]|nr:hypothetical protein [Defluviitaleaceae bacterium]
MREMYGGGLFKRTEYAGAGRDIIERVLAERGLFNWIFAQRVIAQKPFIYAQPKSVEVSLNETAVLSVGVGDITDGGTLSYQWYRGTEDSNAGGRKISQATSETYEPPVNKTGTVYYYVTVTNTNSRAGHKVSVSVTSEPAAVSVSAP